MPDSPVDVLIIDDDPDIRVTLAEVLTCEGYSTHDAATADSAMLWMVEHGTPSLILLDLMMPHVDGIDFVQNYRLANMPEVPFVLVSAAQNVQLRADELGAADYLVKPFDLSELVRIVESYCGRRSPIFGPARDDTRSTPIPPP